MVVGNTTWWVRDQPARPALMRARIMARKRRMYFQRNLGSSAYISRRQGRMLNMTGILGVSIKLS